MRNKWEDVIGRVAKNTEVLCELHFAREDIIDKYEITLSNGMKHIMERGTVTLKSTAAPLASIKVVSLKHPNVYFTNIDVTNLPSLSIHLQIPVPSLEHTVIVPQNENLSTINSSTLLPMNMSKCMPNSVPRTTFNMMNTDMDSSQRQITRGRHTITDENANPAVPKLLQTPTSRTNGISHRQSLKERNLTVLVNTTPAEPLEDVSQNPHHVSPKTLNAPKVTENFEEHQLTTAFNLETIDSQLNELQLPHGWGKAFLGDCILVGHWSNSKPAKKQFFIRKDGSMQVNF